MERRSLPRRRRRGAHRRRGRPRARRRRSRVGIPPRLLVRPARRRRACARAEGGRARARGRLVHDRANAVLSRGLLMSFNVRTVKDLDEFTSAVFAIGQYFGMTPTEERLQRVLDQITAEGMHAAWSNGAIVGGAGAFAFDLSVPGGDLATAGVSVVGVYPTHRRRGVLRALMRTQLDDAHERGEPLAALWASEETIHGRLGYGLASFCGEITLAHEYTAFAHPFEPEGTLRLI